jgi:hypothetical protein
MAALDIFFKRAEKNLEGKIGTEKAQNIFANMKPPLENIPDQFKTDMTSEIPKFILKLSQKADHLNSHQLEVALNHILLFTKSLSGLRDKRRLEINDEILKRSNNRMRSLRDLLEGFVNTAIDGNIVEESLNFEDIIIHTLGKKLDLKTEGKTLPINVQMKSLFEEFPIANEHNEQVIFLSSIVEQCLNTLKNEESERILHQIREHNLPTEMVNKGYYQKINEISGLKENLFLNRTIELLKKQVFTDSTIDKAITGHVAFKIFSKVLSDTINGKNTMVRAAKLRKLIRDRHEAKSAEKKLIGENIIKILHEDLASVKQNRLTFKDTFSIISRKGITIDVYSSLRDRFSEDIIKEFTGMHPLQHIGSEYVNDMVYSDLIRLFDKWTQKIQSCMSVVQTFIRESSAAAPQDAKENVEAILNLFNTLKEMNVNIRADSLYKKTVTHAGRSVLYAFIKYTYETLYNVFSLIDKIKDMKITPMPRFLSKIEEEENNEQISSIEKKLSDAQIQGLPDDSLMVKKQKELLERRKNDSDKFKMMGRLLEESMNSQMLNSITDFGKNLSKILNKSASVHHNLPGALLQCLDNPENFNLEVDNFIESLTEAMNSVIISRDVFESKRAIAEELKQGLNDLCERKEFIENMRLMSNSYNLKE